MTVRVGVVQFPGTNCEQDAVWAFEQVGCTADILWHQRNDLSGFDAVAIAGGSRMVTICAPAQSLNSVP